jgi:transglutaminase-like putative cysteine protease
MTYDDTIHLFGRYPSLQENTDLLRWLADNGLKYWYEEKKEDTVSVYMISHTEQSLLVFTIDTSNIDESNFDQPSSYAASNLRTFDISPYPSIDEAKKALLRDGILFRDVVAAKFLVEDGKSKPDLVVQYQSHDAIVQVPFEQRGVKDAGVVIREITYFSKQDDLYILNDWLASNDLHAPHLFAAEANRWTTGARTVREKALRIAFNVSKSYSYDKTLPLITEFTWRDTLVRDRNGRRGVCDEYAVVQVSYLRSIRVPARLKHLTWMRNGKLDVHTCVEFMDQGRWFHMDGLWNTFNNPGIYRARGASNVRVMDADYPLDSRSTRSSSGKPDPTGDGLLDPYLDFIISPAYPGNARPGYSN